MESITDKLGFLINAAGRLMTIELSGRLKSYDITTTQWGVLKDLCEQRDLPEKCTPASIAWRLNRDRPTISGVIDRLLEKGLVIRLPNSNDRRSQVIQVTEKTLSMIADLDELSEKTIALATTGFDEVELAQLKSFLRRIIENLDVKDGNE